MHTSNGRLTASVTGGSGTSPGPERLSFSKQLTKQMKQFLKQNKKNKMKWSKKHFQILIGVWNCWSLLNERHKYCESLNYDILTLTELHNTQEKLTHLGKVEPCSEQFTQRQQA